MGKLASTLLAVTLCGALAACGSEAAEPPPPAHTSTAPSTPTPTASPSPTPPVMPELAKQHTAAGAKAFVVYYWQVVDYTQSTLDVGPIKAASDPHCSACSAGISAMQNFAKRGAKLTGGIESVSSLKTTSFQPDMPVTVEFVLSNTDQLVTIPGSKTVLHPAGKHLKSMTLVPVTGGWTAADIRSKS